MTRFIVALTLATPALAAEPVEVLALATPELPELDGAVVDPGSVIANGALDALACELPPDSWEVQAVLDLDSRIQAAREAARRTPVTTSECGTRQTWGAPFGLADYDIEEGAWDPMGGPPSLCEAVGATGSSCGLGGVTHGSYDGVDLVPVTDLGNLVVVEDDGTTTVHEQGVVEVAFVVSEQPGHGMQVLLIEVSHDGAELTLAPWELRTSAGVSANLTACDGDIELAHALADRFGVTIDDSPEACATWSTLTGYVFDHLLDSPGGIAATTTDFLADTTGQSGTALSGSDARR